VLTTDGGMVVAGISVTVAGLGLAVASGLLFNGWIEEDTQE